MSVWICSISKVAVQTGTAGDGVGAVASGASGSIATIAGLSALGGALAGCVAFMYFSSNNYGNLS